MAAKRRKRAGATATDIETRAAAWTARERDLVAMGLNRTARDSQIVAILADWAAKHESVTLDEVLSERTEEGTLAAWRLRRALGPSLALPVSLCPFWRWAAAVAKDADAELVRRLTDEYADGFSPRAWIVGREPVTEASTINVRVPASWTLEDAGRLLKARFGERLSGAEAELCSMLGIPEPPRSGRRGILDAAQMRSYVTEFVATHLPQRAGSASAVKREHAERLFRAWMSEAPRCITISARTATRVFNDARRVPGARRRVEFGAVRTRPDERPR